MAITTSKAKQNHLGKNTSRDCIPYAVSGFDFFFHKWNFEVETPSIAVHLNCPSLYVICMAGWFS